MESSSCRKCFFSVGVPLHRQLFKRQEVMCLLHATVVRFEGEIRQRNRQSDMTD